MESWKEIKNTHGKYSVSDNGRVRNNSTGKILKPVPTYNGYSRVGLMIDGKQKFFRVSRLVGDAFIDNPDSLPCINHKDENRANDKAENLEWCTHKYNCSYGRRTEKLKESIGFHVRKYSMQGNFICEYSSINEAVQREGGEWHCLKNACVKRKPYRGFIWEIVKDCPALKLQRYQHSNV